MFTVKAGTSRGMPARKATWRATLGPPPACRAQPMTASSTWAGATPLRRRASTDAAEPSWAAVNDASAPPNLPIGVRTAPATSTSRMRFFLPSRPGRTGCPRHRGKSAKPKKSRAENGSMIAHALHSGTATQGGSDAHGCASCGPEDASGIASVDGDLEAAAAADQGARFPLRDVPVRPNQRQHRPLDDDDDLGRVAAEMGQQLAQVAIRDVRGEVAEAVHVDDLALPFVLGPTPHGGQGQPGGVLRHRSDLLDRHPAREMTGHGAEDVPPMEGRRDVETEQAAIRDGVNASGVVVGEDVAEEAVVRRHE